MSLTLQGFHRRRLNEIKAELDAAFIAAFGVINTAPDSVTGQIVGITAAAFDDVEEMMQDVYDSMYPATASGVSLDNAVALVGIVRLAATPTTVVAMCYGTEGTDIPADSIARSVDGKLYASAALVTIDRANAGDVYLEVSSVLDSINYQIVLDGVTITYGSDLDATAAEIIAGLAALIDPDSFIVTIEDTKLRIRSITQYSDFTLTIDNKLSINKIGSPVSFTCLELGANPLPIGSLNSIVTLTAGWASITNLVEGATGRNIETDEELRTRHQLSVRVVGAATVQAIRARIAQEVDSVTSVSVFENRTHVFQGAMPPHSIETVVAGGSNQAVANKLFEVKPAGIETYGNTSIQVQDDNGDMQLIKFSRPDIKYAWIRVSIDLLYTEEILTSSISEAIKSAVLAYGATINIGTDIIVQRFYGPIYASTTGLGKITVEADVTELTTDTPSYSSVNIPVARQELVQFDASRIEVIGI